MIEPKLTFKSRLPNVGTTIFSRMSALAKEFGAINLGQGFPDFGCDPHLIEEVSAAMRAGHNQYPMMIGVPELRAAIAQQIRKSYGHSYNENTEITVTAGATQALFTAITCCVRPGDEVIVLEPVYDSYIPAIELAGGVVRALPMTADYGIPLQAIQSAINERTRLLIINSPHNPTGAVVRPEEIQGLQDILKGTNVLLCSDEVYEHIIFDQVRHESIARYPDLVARSFVISSFGKSFHVTGWKVGYVCAPEWLTTEFRKVHQFNVFTVNSPMQHGIAKYMEKSDVFGNLGKFYQQKRDFFMQGLKKTGFEPLPSMGTYFQCVNYTKLGIPEAQLGDLKFAEWLNQKIGVTSIPLSAFYGSRQDTGVIRFCFAKLDGTLDEALKRLQKI